MTLLLKLSALSLAALALSMAHEPVPELCQRLQQGQSLLR